MRFVIVASIVGVALGSATSADAITDKYNVTPQEHAACDGDALLLCSDVPHDADSLLACMKAKHTQLSSLCLATFKAGLERRHMKL